MLDKLMNLTRYAADDGGDGTPPPAATAATPPAPGEGDGETPLANWDEVLAGLPEPHRALYEQQTAGLTSALNSEREQRKELAKQLRDATQGLEKNSEARQELERISATLDVAQQRADFYEEASRPEIGCANLKLAYMAAQSDDLISDKGRVDWGALKEHYPELFKVARMPPGNAGNGTQSPPPRSKSMDDLIRRAAGVAVR